MASAVLNSVFNSFLKHWAISSSRFFFFHHSPTGSILLRPFMYEKTFFAALPRMIVRDDNQNSLSHISSRLVFGFGDLKRASFSPFAINFFYYLLHLADIFPCSYDAKFLQGCFSLLVSFSFLLLSHFAEICRNSKGCFSHFMKINSTSFGLFFTYSTSCICLKVTAPVRHASISF